MKKFDLISNNPMTKKEVSRMLDKNTPHDLQFIMKEIEKNQEFFYSYFISLPKGETLWLDTTIVSIDNRQNGVEIAAGFINERSDTDYRDSVNTRNDEDNKSGLPNMTYGWEYLENKINKSKQKNKKFTVYKVLIAQFNKILNTFGHEIATEVISKTSKRLVQFMYEKGFIFHSYTDGWYAVVRGEKNLQEMAGKLISIVQKPLIVNNQIIHLNANVGIGLYPRDGENVADLMKHTTIAASSAVEMGPGREGFYIQDKTIGLLRESQLTADLFQSIQNNELYLEYQPKIDIKTLTVTGAEALLRWKHPIWENVSPAEFIPLAKSMGLDEDITVFVIGKSIQQLKKWQDAGVSSPRISINLAPENFLLPNLYQFIKKTLKKYKVSPEQFEIEITEETKLKYDETLISTIERIQSLGVKLALDDLGSGFSSVYDLLHYNFNTVKIDRQAIDDLENSEEQQIIIKALLDLFRRLKVTTVVEGVERKEQFDIIREIGCDQIQGFYFSPSISSEEMTKWFQMDYAVPSNAPEERRLERRKYFRVKLSHSLTAKMRILSIQEKEITLERDTKILIQDIGPGGLKFYSYLHLPAKDSIVYGFDIELLGEHYNLTGKIVWNQELKKGIFEHGVEFSISESEREKLTSALFKLSAILREQPSYTDNSIIEEEPVLHLRKLNIKRKTEQ